MENKERIFSLVEEYIDSNYSPDNYQYESELNDAILELKDLSKGSNASLYDSIIDYIENEEDFDFSLLSDADVREFTAELSEIAWAQIVYINEHCEVIDDTSDWNDDNDDWN